MKAVVAVIEHSETVRAKLPADSVVYAMSAQGALALSVRTLPIRVMITVSGITRDAHDQLTSCLFLSV